MEKKLNQNKFLSFREQYKTFIFESFDYQVCEKSIDIKFHFNLADTYSFYPELKIPINKHFLANNMKANLNNFVFNIGMIELVSYWKSTCSPKVIIKPYLLEEEQISFWKKIYFHGLGEFFYLNSIETDIDSFMEIECVTEMRPPFSGISINLNEIIVPVGGGKDSVVSMELVKESGYNSVGMIVNPRGASMETAKTAGYRKEDIIIIYRTIHKQLLELNAQGFLNGHTPFSATLGFITAFIAALTGKMHIALSNESSANEATVGNTKINHQYSKSFEFEEDFRKYINDWASTEINYFSLLRPLNELQIAKLFSSHPKYQKVFKSCNVGSKKDEWCGNCPKCLFTYIILSPFLKQEELISIFGSDLFENKELQRYFDELTGIAEVKPFECVGTTDEVNAALNYTINNKMNSENLPALLKKYVKTNFYKKDDISFEQHIAEFNSKNNVPMDLISILKQKIN